jgi:hypothetical protein
LVIATIAYLGYYALYLADADFKLGLANDMRVLIIMGVGTSLAIFGLGRTVGRK